MKRVKKSLEHASKVFNYIMKKYFEWTEVKEINKDKLLDVGIKHDAEYGISKTLCKILGHILEIKPCVNEKDIENYLRTALDPDKISFLISEFVSFLHDFDGLPFCQDVGAEVIDELMDELLNEFLYHLEWGQIDITKLT